MTDPTLDDLIRIAREATPGRRRFVRSGSGRTKRDRSRDFGAGLNDGETPILSGKNGAIVLAPIGGVYPAADEAHAVAFDAARCEALVDCAKQLNAQPWCECRREIAIDEDTGLECGVHEEVCACCAALAKLRAAGIAVT